MQPSESDADALFPDRVVSAGGEQITVRRFTMREAFRLAPLAHPIIEAVGGMMDQAVADGRSSIHYGDFVNAVAKFPDEFMGLVSAACGKPVEWIEALSVGEGDELLATFWEINRDFFMRRLVMRRATAVHRAMTGERQASPKS